MDRFKIVTHVDVDDLSRLVEAYLNDGWEIAAPLFTKKNLFYAPMIKEEEIVRPDITIRPERSH